MGELTFGTRLGDYEILGELGRGGMGVVYAAREPALERTIAIKVLPAHLANDDDYTSRFQAEARLIGQLNHPNIVTIHAIGEDKGLRFIVMERVRGRELSSLLTERGQLPVGEALAIARQVAGALGAAHRLRIIHRDIKPQNIMVDEVGRVKVMDFGIAKWTGETASGVTQDGEMLGTPAYMSREQVLGMTLDGRTDLYSLGVVLYQMLSGELPFKGENAAAVIQKIMNEPPPVILSLRPDLPGSIVEVLRRLMAKDPDDRYANAIEAERDIERTLLLQAAPQDMGTMTTQVMSRLIEDAQSPVESIPPRAAESRREEAKIKTSLGSRILKSKTLRGAFIAAALLIPAAMLFRSDIGKPETPQALTKPPQLEAAIPKPPAPEIEWIQSPAEGATVAFGQVFFAWKPRNNAPVEKFLIGLNELDPQTEIIDSSKTFELTAAGPQIIKIIPLGIGGIRGEPLVRTFHFLPPKTDTPPQKIKGIELGAALRLFSGADGKVDEAEARRSVNAAADSGSALAKMWLGWFYHWGRCGVPKDAARAKSLTQSALDSVRQMAEENNADAAFLLGAALDQGLVAKRDSEAALRWVRKAADQGQTTAMNYLGWMYFEGHGPQRDDSEAMKWFTAAAERSDVGGMHNLGWMYLQGRGGQKDFEKATLWLRRAADAGSPRAMSSMGYLYQEGQGVQRDDARALEWFRKAADLGDPQALFILGARYEEGRSVERDRRLALSYYSKAASLGYEPAQAALGRLQKG